MTVLAAVTTLALVSCEEPARVVDRPLPGFNGAPYIAGTQPVAPSTDQTDILNQLSDTSSIGIDPNTQPGMGVQPLTQPAGGSGTINQILNPSNPSSTPTVPPQQATPKQAPVTPQPVQPQPTKPSESIQTAWPTEDPMIVFSPYDRTKKIRIQKADGTRQAPGTIMRDPHFPDRKFIVP